MPEEEEDEERRRGLWPDPDDQALEKLLEDDDEPAPVRQPPPPTATTSTSPPPPPAPFIKQYGKLMRKLAGFYETRRRNARASPHVKRLHDELWSLSPHMWQAMDTVALWTTTIVDASPGRRRAFDAAVSALGDILLNVPTMDQTVLSLVNQTGPPGVLARARSVFVEARSACLSLSSPRRRPRQQQQHRHRKS